MENWPNTHFYLYPESKYNYPLILCPFENMQFSVSVRYSNFSVFLNIIQLPKILAKSGHDKYQLEVEMIYRHQVITKQQITSYLLKAGIKNLIYSVPDESATTKCFIVHFRNKYWKLINFSVFQRYKYVSRP